MKRKDFNHNIITIYFNIIFIVTIIIVINNNCFIMVIDIVISYNIDLAEIAIKRNPAAIIIANNYSNLGTITKNYLPFY